MKREIIYRQPGNDENKIIAINMAYWQLKEIYNNCIIYRDNLMKNENTTCLKTDELIEFLYQLLKENAPDRQKTLFEDSIIIENENFYVAKLEFMDLKTYDVARKKDNETIKGFLDVNEAIAFFKSLKN